MSVVSPHFWYNSQLLSQKIQRTPPHNPLSVGTIVKIPSRFASIGRGTAVAINIVVAVTDYDWFKTLSQAQNLSEVNFWAPSASNFRALRPGELFLFKLHAPHNQIVGGGIFAYANILPCSLAWQAFGEANGAASYGEMRSRIVRYRRTDPNDKSDFEIGCRILTEPFFFDEPDWISPPSSFARNIVTFKTYNTADQEGFQLWSAIQGKKRRSEGQRISEEGRRYGTPQIVTPRLGQGAFRVVVTDAYGRRCAVTGERTPTCAGRGSYTSVWYRRAA